MMSNNTVYLSKSNRANPDHVMVVRRHLEGLGYDVLEHGGGEYDHQLIYEPRYMVMVGLHTATIANQGFITVGKGQYVQLLNRRNKSTNYYNLYFTGFDIAGDPIYKKVVNNGVIDENNWTHGYGELKVIMNVSRKLPKRSTVVTESCSNNMVQRIHLACITLLK